MSKDEQNSAHSFTEGSEYNSEQIEVTQAQIDELNRHQWRNEFHPYTCGKDSTHKLVATKSGWACPICDYTQPYRNEFVSPAPVDNQEELAILFAEWCALHGWKYSMAGRNWIGKTGNVVSSKYLLYLYKQSLGINK